MDKIVNIDIDELNKYDKEFKNVLIDIIKLFLKEKPNPDFDEGQLYNKLSIKYGFKK